MTLEQFSQLGSKETLFYQRILREFPARGGPPDAAWLAATAAAYGLDAETTLNRFAELDLLVRDAVTGTITSMYPFSAVPTRHSVVLAAGQPVFSMCAIDALGIPFMLNEEAVILSADPVTGTPIRVEVRGGKVTWEPVTTVVLTVSLEHVEGAKAVNCCPVMNFFASVDSAEEYRRSHCEVPGVLLNQQEALERSKRAFGGLLAPTGPV